MMGLGDKLLLGEGEGEDNMDNIEGQAAAS